MSCSTRDTSLHDLCIMTLSLGLMNVLRHSQADRIPFATRDINRELLKQSPINAKFLNFGDAPPVAWADITHVNYSNPDNPTPPPYSLYTGLTSKHSFIAFVSIWLLQIICIWIKNVCSSTSFTTLSFFDQILHSFQSVIVPTPAVDWASGPGNCFDHYTRMKRALREVVSTLLINFFFQFIHLTPIIYLGKLH